MSWTPTSWAGLPIQQQPTYADPAAVQVALAKVRSLPPLVSPGEVDALRGRLAEAARGEMFLLQGGDCAERFQDCRRGPIEAKLKILLQMSLVLTWGARVPVVRVARLAGQYAKPRSSDTELVDGVLVPSYRGDHVNGHDLGDRRADPERLVEAYFHSAATLNYVRALLAGGFADLHRPHHWDLGFVRSAARRERYAVVRDRMLDSLDFLDAVGVGGGHGLRTVELYASHEGLILGYEAALTVPSEGGYYNLGSHMQWIGHRTRQLEGAHVEYFRGLRNPLGLKVGPGLEAEELVALLDRLDPDHLPGRMVLYSRFGAERVKAALPPLVEAVRASGHPVVWSCDPMHGNTRATESGVKTRDFGAVLKELVSVIDVHESMGSRLAGVHLELTGDDVTECVGGPQELAESDLAHNYESVCDPRLNYAQSLEVAYLLADRLRQRR